MKDFALFVLCILFLSGTADARVISGEVIGDGKGLSKVIVTDGESFTTTASDGKFSFDIKDDAEFVYIVTPSIRIYKVRPSTDSKYMMLIGGGLQY